jgi:hypothetical protein
MTAVTISAKETVRLISYQINNLNRKGVLPWTIFL